MTTEELLLEKWRDLNPAKQMQVIAFADRLLPKQTTDSPLGRKLPARSVKSSIPPRAKTPRSHCQRAK
jgi:hypothetical protein